MSQRNVELVKGLQPDGVDLVDLFAEDEHGGSANLRAWASADLFADGLEVRFISGAHEVENVYRGLEGFIRGWRDWLDPWASYRVDVDAVIEAGDRVLTLIRVRAQTSRDRVAMEHSPAAVWTVEDGRVASIHMYLERAEALREVDLAPEDVPSQGRDQV